MEVIGPIQVKIENERPIALFMQVFSLDEEMLTTDSESSLINCFLAP
jgi:hypothetical protein